MKRYILILILVLFLAGCSKKPEPPVQTTTLPEIPSSSWYEQGSAIENQTNGTLRLFRVNSTPVTELANMGDKLLLISQNETVELTVLNSTTGEPLANCVLPENAAGLQPIYNAAAYYLPETKTAVYLDHQLQQISEITIPDAVEGIPVFAPDGGEIFYCVGQEIRAYDTSRNITRPVRTHTCESQMLTGIYFNGKLLSCTMTLADGSSKQVYVSTETGQPFGENGNLKELSTFEENYVALRMDGTVHQQIFGTRDNAVTQNLNIPQKESSTPAATLGGVIGTRMDETETLNLSFYETESGKRTAALSVSGVGAPVDLHPDEKNQCVWILTQDSATNEQIVCRWDYLRDSVAEETVYTTPVYSKTNLDKEGIKACDKRAEELNSIHGIDIRVWDDATRTTGGHTVEGEYQTDAINAVLDELEIVLAEYPENFLYKSVNRLLRINLVRSIDGEQKGIQIWKSSECYILLTPGCDIRDQFSKAMGYVINSRVLGNSPLWDDWASLNPEGFVYGETADESLLNGETKAFVDKDAMTSVTEDRSRLFWQAVRAENAEMFQSATMQAKLRQLCLGIRDAWRWENKKEIYPWEQYLTEPLAPQ